MDGSAVPDRDSIVLSPFRLDLGRASAPVEPRLEEVHPDGGRSPRPECELTTGLLPDEAADVREDDDHEVPVRPHPEDGPQRLDEPLDVCDQEVPIGGHEREDARNAIPDRQGERGDEIDLARRDVVRVGLVGDQDDDDREEGRKDSLPRRPRAPAADVAGDHRTRGLDPPQEE